MEESPPSDGQEEERVLLSVEDRRADREQAALLINHAWCEEDLFLEDVMALETMEHSREEQSPRDALAAAESSFRGGEEVKARLGSGTAPPAGAGQAKLTLDLSPTMFTSPEVSSSHLPFFSEETPEAGQVSAGAVRASEEEEGGMRASQAQSATALVQAAQAAAVGSGPPSQRQRPMSPSPPRGYQGFQRMRRSFTGRDSRGSGLSEMLHDGGGLGLGFGLGDAIDRARMSMARQGGSPSPVAGSRRRGGRGGEAGGHSGEELGFDLSGSAAGSASGGAPEAGQPTLAMRQMAYLESRASNFSTLRMRRQRREARDARQREEGWPELRREAPRETREGAGGQQPWPRPRRAQQQVQEDVAPPGGAVGGTPFSKRPKFWGLTGRRSPLRGGAGPSSSVPSRDGQGPRPPSGMWAEGGAFASSTSGVPSSPPATPSRPTRRPAPLSAGQPGGSSDPMDADSDDSVERLREWTGGGPGDYRRRGAGRRWAGEGRGAWGEGGGGGGRAGGEGGPQGGGPGRVGPEGDANLGGETGEHGMEGSVGSRGNVGLDSGWQRGEGSGHQWDEGFGAAASPRGRGKGHEKGWRRGSGDGDGPFTDREGGNGLPLGNDPGKREGGRREPANQVWSGRDGANGPPVPNDGVGKQGEVGAGPQYELAEDPLYKVFSFLDQTGLCRAAMVCRQWRRTSEQEEFWKHLNFENRGVTHQDVARLCAKYPRAVTLNLRGAPCVDESLARVAMRSLWALETLVLGNGYLSDAFFWALAECQTLRTVKVSEAVLGSGGAQEIQIRHNGLRELEITGCRVLRMAVRCPALESLSLKRTTAASATLLCPELTKLNVSHCHKLSDSGVRAAATACPQLTSLDISHCAFVSDETLREIAAACPSLSQLNASQCPNLSLEGVRLHSMVDLTLNACEGITATSMAALSHCRLLATLRLDWCCLLSAVSLDLPLLQSVSLTQCKKLTEVVLCSPGLVALNVTQCSMLSRIDVASSEVETLALREQLGLTSIALRCPRLRQVDLSDCDSLTDSVFKVFSEGGGCPQLTSLILDNCEGLTAVELFTKQLRQLSLVGCRNINSIDLACPALSSLLLDGCDRLASASLAPVGLSDLNLGICPHLAKLQIQGTKLTQLDLRGCGALSEATLACQQLVSLDASYCSQLGDSCLAAIAQNCPSVQTLVLAACPNITSAGLLALKGLNELTTLDLSYTFLTDLAAVFEACAGLHVLQLSACKYLEDHALRPLSRGAALPHLRELDISYGSLGKGAVEDLLALSPHLVTISLNGCEHISDAIWQRIAMPPSDAFQGPDPSNSAATLDVEMCEPGGADGGIGAEGGSGGAGAQGGEALPGGGDSQRKDLRSQDNSGLDWNVWEAQVRDARIREGGLGQAQVGEDRLGPASAAFVWDVAMGEAAVGLGAPISGGCAGVGLNWEGSSSMGQAQGPVAEMLEEGNGGEAPFKVLDHGDSIVGRMQIFRRKWGLAQWSGEGGDLKGKGPEEENGWVSASAVLQDDAQEEVNLNRVLTDESLKPGTHSGAPEGARLLGLRGKGLNGPDSHTSSRGMKSRPAGSGQPRKLQVLSAVGCSTLRSVCIPSSAACSHLLSLNLSLARNVSQVRLACPNLNSLNLSNCFSLEDVHLDCPRLTSLCLQGCALDGDILEQAVLGCPQLETLDIRNCPKMSTRVLNKIRTKCPWVRRLYHSLLG